MEKEKKHNNYLKFFAMIATSMLAMFFLMYLNSYQIFDHFWFSETRMYMTLIMGGAMLIIMLVFMLHMYKNNTINAAIIIGGFLLILASVWLVRSQNTVSDVDYMEGMIPHHSIAILTSERAMIEDVRVRKLADEIIAAQRREIKEMEWLINDIRKSGIATTEEEKERRPVPEFEGSTEKETAGLGRLHTLSAQEELITIESTQNIQQTATRLEELIKQKGLTFFAKVDHAKNDTEVNMNLSPTVLLFFGNPILETPLIQCAQTYAIDLPQKALVYEDKDGRMLIAYNDLSYLANRHNPSDSENSIIKAKGTLSALIKEAANPE